MTDTQFVPNLTTPSLVGLAYLLRHKELWPKDFVWSYRTSNKCAIGLASAFWPAVQEFGRVPFLYWAETQNYFGAGFDGFLNVFTERFEGTPYDDVQPEQVADRIDIFVQKIGFIIHE
jgi:hypothetical protein